MCVNLMQLFVKFALFALLERQTSSFVPVVQQRTRREASSFSRWLSSRLIPLGLSDRDDEIVASSAVCSTDDPMSMVRRLTEDAIQHRGEPKGLAALEKLGERSSQRLPYDFSVPYVRKGSVLSPKPGLLPRSVTTDFLNRVGEMETNGWLSTNPDSVDRLPSLHVNLVSSGKPCVPGTPSDSFEQSIQDLFELVKPYIYDELLPGVRSAMNSPDICVSEVFLRRYGEDLVDGATRRSISAHYDVSSIVTSVVAMDDTAADGTNGLYTTVASQDSSASVGRTSNHASLRRYFPLEAGDAVVHTWDVLHGVDIQPGSDRTSLIVWFSTKDALAAPDSVSPWLCRHPDLEIDEIAQFVMGSACESTGNRGVAEGPSTAKSAGSVMTFRESVATREDYDLSNLSACDFYLKSATRGNAFALARLGDLCEEQALSPDKTTQCASVLESLSGAVVLPENLRQDWCSEEESSLSPSLMAMQCWMEAALRGSPGAQLTLADKVMEQALSCTYEDEANDLRLLAATLFGLAAQQGNDAGLEALSRVIGIDIVASGIESEEEFRASKIVQIAQVADAF